MSYRPRVKWAQRKDKVYLTVVLLAAKDVKVNVDPEGVFTFSALAGGENRRCGLKLDLFGKVNVEESTHTVGVGNICCVIGKAEKGWWKNLLRSTEKTPHYIQLDWEKWVDVDEADETPEVSTGDMGISQLGGMDMANLTQGMGEMDGKGDSMGEMDGKGDKCIKRCPRPYLTPEILYNEDKWIEWALSPYNLEDLIKMRNKDGRFMFIHVAGIEALGSGFIIRDYHGTPIYAYSESISENEPVAEFYLEVKAVNKSLELAKQYDFKYVSMVSTSAKVASIVGNCYCEEIPGDCSDGNKEMFFVKQIASELRFRRNANPEENLICFHIHPGSGEKSSNPAFFLAGLAASEKKSELAISFNQGSEEVQVAKDKLGELLKLLYTEASSKSLFHP